MSTNILWLKYLFHAIRKHTQKIIKISNRLEKIQINEQARAEDAEQLS